MNNNFSVSESQKALIVQGFPGFLFFDGYKMATFGLIFVASGVKWLSCPAGWLPLPACLGTGGCRCPWWSAHVHALSVLRSAGAKSSSPSAGWRGCDECHAHRFVLHRTAAHRIPSHGRENFWCRGTVGHPAKVHSTGSYKYAGQFSKPLVW